MKKYDNFCASLGKLDKIHDYEEPYDTVILTGLVGLYEVCFEQAWKAMKEILETQGYAQSATGSPRMVLKTAYQAGMIKDEAAWLDALQECNNVAHSYNENVALGIVRRTGTEFYELFRGLKAEIEKNWL